MKISKLLFKSALNGFGLMFIFTSACKIFQRPLPDTTIGMIALGLIAMFVGFVFELGSIQELTYKGEIDDD